VRGEDFGIAFRKWSLPKFWQKVLSRSMWCAAERIKAATAQTAFFRPRRCRSACNYACASPAFLRVAAEAHGARVVLSEGTPWL
jgi:hypothetical protein